MPDSTPDEAQAWLAGYRDGLQPAEPIPVMVRRYRCPHCRRSRASRQAMVEHIGRCWYAPENRTCKTCRHLDPGDYGDLAIGYPGSGPDCMAAVPLFNTENPVTHCQEWEASDG